MSQMGIDGGMSQQTYTSIYDVQVQGLQGMNSMLQVTNQYAASADSLLGKVARLGIGLGTLSKHYAGLKPQNAGAVSEAARYEQQLSSLSATIAVSTKGTQDYNKSFSQLRDTTKALARDFPIGMGQAVQQMDALQQSGVKDPLQQKALATTYTQLGLANSESGPALGADMQSLNQMYSASTKQAQGYADSLTTVTQKLGGTASGTLAFAKQIAPIASTVGMGESQVIGLSNAFSKLGEDGTGAATAVNKVLLDMNRSVRQGTPEVSTYAKLLDMSTGDLTKLFKSDPTEVLTRFTEAVAKRGPDAQASLESLGLDSVRTTRSIQALAQGGGLRSAINTAVQGYNSGSTASGAAAATGGLNDELMKLQETTRQTVEATGRPFLGFLSAIVSGANAAASAINKIVNSSIMQKLGVVGAIGGTAVGGVLSVARMGLLAATGVSLFNRARGALGSRREDFALGRRTVVNEGEQAFQDMLNSPNNDIGSKRAARAGAEMGRRTGLAGAGAEERPAFRQRTLTAMQAAGQATRRGILGTAGLTEALLRAQRFEVEEARTGERPVTPAREAYRLRMAQARGELTPEFFPSPAATGVLPQTPITASTKLAARIAATRDLINETTNQGGTIRGALGAAGWEGLRTTGAGVGYAASFARTGVKETFGLLRDSSTSMAKGIGAAGSTLGLNPMTLGAGALIMAGTKAYQISQDNAAKVDASKNAAANPWGGYNDFAAAMGRAGRSTSGFADAAVQATNQLKSITTSKGGDPYKWGSEQQRMAQNYTGAIPLPLTSGEQGHVGTGGWLGFAAQKVGQLAGIDPGGLFSTSMLHGANKQISQKELIAKAALTLGNHATADDINGVLLSYAKQGIAQPEVQNIAAGLGKIYGTTGYGKPGYGMGFESAFSAQSRSPNLGGVGSLSDEAVTAMSQTFAQVGQATDQTGQVWGNKSAQLQQYSELNHLMSAFAKKRSSVRGPEATMLDDTYRHQLATTLGINPDDLKGQEGATSLDQLFAGIKGSKDSNTKSALRTYQQATLGGPISEAQIAAAATAPGYAGRERQARGVLDANYASTTGQKVDSKSWDTSLYSMSDKLFHLGKTIDQTDKTITAGMNPMQKALYDLEKTPTDVTKYIAGTQMAQEQLKRYHGNASMAVLGLAVSGDQIQSTNQQDAAVMGQQYLQSTVMPVRTAQESSVGALRDRIVTGTAAAKSLGQIQTAPAQAAAMASQADAAQAQSDLINMKKQYEQDIISTNRSIQISNQQEQISETRSNEAYQRSRLYAEQDYNTQIIRSRQAFALQMNQAQQDYQKTIHRAEQDYQTSRLRAEESYGRSRQRTIEDQNRQETYAIQDHQRQVGYLLKDAASNMYSPYKRIQAHDVMDASGLASNLNQQAAMLRQQSANVLKLKKLGLSQRAIDSLDLYNPDNADQVQRLVEDISQNRNQAVQLDAAVAGKDAAAAPLATANQSFRRSEEEFATGQKRMADANKLALTRMATDEHIAMLQMAQDEHKNLLRAASDNATMIARARKANAIAMTNAAADQTKALTRMATAQGVAIGQMRADATRSNALTMQALGIEGRNLTKSAGELAKESAKIIANTPRAWTGPLVASINVMNTALAKGLGTTGVIVGTAVARGVASVTKVASGVGSVNYLTNQGSAHTGKVPGLPYALGGIAMAPHLGLVAEAGVPEAMIPLNERGAAMLHQVMARYATQDQTRGAHAQSYARPAGPTTNLHTYDYSTQVESVTVVASDPHEMFRQLENIASTKRLIQPAGNQAVA